MDQGRGSLLRRDCGLHRGRRAGFGLGAVGEVLMPGRWTISSKTLSNSCCGCLFFCVRPASWPGAVSVALASPAVFFPCLAQADEFPPGGGAERGCEAVFSVPQRLSRQRAILFINRLCPSVHLAEFPKVQEFPYICRERCG